MTKESKFSTALAAWVILTSPVSAATSAQDTCEGCRKPLPACVGRVTPPGEKPSRDLQTDVTEAEWLAAEPVSESAPLPEVRVAGKPVVLPCSPSAATNATVLYVIRADGAVGIYKVTTNDEDVATALVCSIRGTRYAPPVRDGRTVPLRGEYSLNILPKFPR